MDLADAYVDNLAREISLRAACFGGNLAIEQLHFGGGTPTFLPPRRLVEIVDRIDRDFALTSAESRDYSIEIDPRGANRTLLRLLGGLGFNRLSFGVQDFDGAVQRAVNRVQPAEIVESVYATARELGFRSINFDLIYGLPCRRLRASVRRSRACGDAPGSHRGLRLRAFAAALQGPAADPHEDLRTPAHGWGCSRLPLTPWARPATYTSHGSFCITERPLAQALEARTLHRTFQGYTTHADLDLINLGVSAIGKVGNLFVQNHKKLGDYEQSLAGIPCLCNGSAHEPG